MWCNLGWNADYWWLHHYHLLFVTTIYEYVVSPCQHVTASWTNSQLSTCITHWAMSLEDSGICLVFSCNKVIRTVDNYWTFSPPSHEALGTVSDSWLTSFKLRSGLRSAKIIHPNTFQLKSQYLSLIKRKLQFSRIGKMTATALSVCDVTTTVINDHQGKEKIKIRLTLSVFGQHFGD